MHPVTDIESLCNSIATIIENGGNHNGIEEHIEALERFQRAFGKFKQTAVTYVKAIYKKQYQQTKCSSISRAHRRPTKSTKPSGSSDSDGGPSASDSSDRCILCFTPLLHFLCFSRISVVNKTAKSSIHIHYGHAIAVIITILIRHYFASLALFHIDMPTSFRMGSHHV